VAEQSAKVHQSTLTPLIALIDFDFNINELRLY
jgi:hypothetical protein